MMDKEKMANLLIPVNFIFKCMNCRSILNGVTTQIIQEKEPHEVFVQLCDKCCAQKTDKEKIIERIDEEISFFKKEFQEITVYAIKKEYEAIIYGLERAKRIIEEGE
jgi:hypothetical protein